MSEELNISIRKLRAVVLTRRIKKIGYSLESDDAQRLVDRYNDATAYEEAVQRVQRQSFWSRFFG